MISFRVLVAALFAFAGLSSLASQADAEDISIKPLKGEVLFLGSHEDIPQPPPGEHSSVNAGGLVIVKIADLGSSPVEIDDVKCSDAFAKLGTVRGVGFANGEFLMGGGYTWCLFQAKDTARSGTITVKYTGPPHVGGGTETETYKVDVTVEE